MSRNGIAEATPQAAATVSRKADHIRINIEEDVRAKGVTTGFERVRLVHRALPEIDLDDVSLVTRFVGRRIGAPLLISCMTGGTPEAETINARLAEAAQERRLAMGLGSCRVLLEQPDVLPSFAVRRRAPDILLLANLGAVQLNRGAGPPECRRIMDMLEADALVLHLNPLQEALQPEGDTCFAGLLGRIEAVCEALSCAVVVKEVGWGIDPTLVRRLLEAGVAAVDVAGAGGTSWSEVERHRMPDARRARIAAAFAGWGIPTADAIRRARAAAPEAEIVGSGGITCGIDVAKALALGADVAGMAGPLLRAAATGEEQLSDCLDGVLEELRIAMFCTGACTPGDLRAPGRLDADGLTR